MSFRDLLPVLVKRLGALPKKKGTAAANAAEDQSEKQRKAAVDTPSAEEEADEKKFGKGVITQAYIWPRMAKFFKEWDVILAETGTSGESAAPTTLVQPTAREPY